jgi:tRNA(fMet)-specific endonuclease VapC
MSPWNCLIGKKIERKVPFLIDTNIAIHARDGFDLVLDKFVQYPDAISMSALSLAELQRGIRKPSPYSVLRRERLHELLLGVTILPFDEAAAEAYGEIIAVIGWSRGKEMDRLIAAHALATNSVLVTANTSDFAPVPGLKIVDWTLAV